MANVDPANNEIGWRSFPGINSVRSDPLMEADTRGRRRVRLERLEERRGIVAFLEVTALVWDTN